MATVAANSEVRDLVRKINATGAFKVVKNGQRHHKVLTKAGAAVTDENGPLIISATPSDRRWREMTIKRLIGAGVLSSDPYKETRPDAEANDGQKRKGGRGRNSPLSDPVRAEAIHAAKIEAIKAKSRRLNEQTQHVRSDLEPLIVKLGGWGMGASGVKASEFGLVMRHWAIQRGRMEFPEDAKDNDNTVRTAAQTLKTPGKTLGEKWLPIFRLFVDDLLEADKKDKAEGVRKRWFELYRQWKGIPSEETTTVRPMEPPAQTNGHGHTTLRVVGGVVQAERPAEDRVPMGPLHDPVIPALALEAMWLMAKGSDDRDKAMEVAEKILKLEMERG